MPGKVRIISGQWRGRKLDVPDVSGLRPSGDRVREVLFNWLQGRIAGKRCLDLFAGTGALGLEAVSRGAAAVTLVDNNRQLCRALDEIKQQWPGAEVLGIVNQDVVQFLAQAPARHGLEPFDCIFLDPPFEAGFHDRCLQLLQENGWLSGQALVYVESAAGDDRFALKNWQTQRDKRIGDVRMLLLASKPLLAVSD